MTHDLTHCDYQGCRKRYTCRRYLAHLDRINRSLKGAYPYLTHEGTPSDGCAEYLPLTTQQTTP